MSSPIHELVYSMQRDVQMAMRSLKATVRTLMLRGQSLESLVEQGDDLEQAAILLNARAEVVTQRILAQNRSAASALRRRLMRCLCSAICVGLLVTFLCMPAAWTADASERTQR